jgi:hypothetical protein
MSNSSATMTNSIVEDNIAYMGTAAIQCGNSILTLTDTTIRNNYSEEGRGGISIGSSTLIVTNCTFSSNGAGYFAATGGAIGMYSSNAKITNSIFSGNKPTLIDGNGGAISLRGSTATITNCTFTGNRTSEAIIGSPFPGNDVGGAISVVSGSEAIITNSILWGDIAKEAPEEIYIDDTSSAAVNYCIIDQDGYAGTNGNIREDPLFVDPGYWDDNGTPTVDDDFWVEGDYHLLPDSPAIDAGTKDAPELPKFDFEGDPRKKGKYPDIGADEFKKQKHTH